MTNKEFLSDVQKACHLDSQHCSMFLNALCRLMAQAAVEQVAVTLDGLGTFISHKHPEYIQEDPLTGQQTLYPPRITYRMHAEQPSDELNPLPRELSEHTRTNLSDCQRFLDAVVTIIQGTLAHNEEVEVHGLGTFRIVSNSMGDLQRVAYSPDDQMRSLVNAPFNCFEPVVISNTAKKEAVAPVVAEDTTNEEEPDNNREEVETQEESAPASEIETEKTEEPSEAEPDKPQIVRPVPAPTPLKAPVFEQDLVDEDEAEDNRRRRRKPFYFTLAGLLLILVGSLVWFFGFKVENRGPVVALNESKTQPIEPVAAVDTIQADTIAVAPDTITEILAQNEGVTPPQSVEPEAAKQEPATEQKQPEPTAEVAKPVDTTPKAAKGGVSAIGPTKTDVWRIQFLTAGEVYPAGDSHLGGLTPVSYYRETKYYKYTYGEAANKADLAEAMKTVRKVFKDAFYVQFNADGTRKK